MPRRGPAHQWLLIGVVCGLVAVLLVRSAAFLVVASLKGLLVVAALVALWLFVRGPRDGRR